jgi:hypothetical protein
LAAQTRRSAHSTRNINKSELKLLECQFHEEPKHRASAHNEPCLLPNFGIQRFHHGILEMLEGVLKQMAEGRR